MRFNRRLRQAFLLSLAAIIASSCKAQAPEELEADVKELRADVRELREELRELRKENRELRTKVDGAKPPADEPGAGSGTAAGSGTGTGTGTGTGAGVPNAGSADKPPKQATVKIQIDSNPTGASVFVGEKVVGKTPLLFQTRSGTEPLLLRVDKPGFQPRLLSVVPNEDTKLSFQLSRQ